MGCRLTLPKYPKEPSKDSPPPTSTLLLESEEDRTPPFPIILNQKVAISPFSPRKEVSKSTDSSPKDNSCDNSGNSPACVIQRKKFIAQPLQNSPASTPIIIRKQETQLQPQSLTRQLIKKRVNFFKSRGTPGAVGLISPELQVTQSQLDFFKALDKQIEGKS